MINTINKNLDPLPISLKYITDEGKLLLAEHNMSNCEIYAFQINRQIRPIQLALILKDAININFGKLYNIEDSLAIELKRLLSSVCYLFNSTSFRIGKYQDFDKLEINTKLHRDVK